MQSMLNLCGVPLCLSGIINPLPLSKEMADHDRRRKSMKKQRALTHANQQKHEDIGDLDDIILHDLFHTHLFLTAKAA